MNGRTLRVGLLLVVLIALVLGVLRVSLHNEDDTKATLTVEPLKVSSKEQMDIQYVPKRHPKDNDVEITKEPLLVEVNGVQEEIPTDNVEETHKFENGKLIVEQKQELKLTIPEPTRVKKGLYIEYEPIDNNQVLGARLAVQNKSYDIDFKAELYNKKHDNRITVSLTKWL